MIEREFGSYEELWRWCNDNPLTAVWWGHIESFDGWQYTEELMDDMSPDWFENGPVTIYIKEEDDE